MALTLPVRDKVQSWWSTWQEVVTAGHTSTAGRVRLSSLKGQWIKFLSIKKSPKFLTIPLRMDDWGWCSFKSADPNSDTLCFLGVVGSTRSGWLFRFIQLQTNKLLHALPVLHLGGAVGVILT